MYHGYLLKVARFSPLHSLQNSPLGHPNEELLGIDVLCCHNQEPGSHLLGREKMGLEEEFLPKMGDCQGQSFNLV